MLSDMVRGQPLLDVLMFSRSLARIMGWRGQFVLYAYYLASALGLRALSPPLALITAQETGLSGAFRAAHQAHPPSCFSFSFFIFIFILILILILILIIILILILILILISFPFPISFSFSIFFVFSFFYAFSIQKN